MKKIMRKVIGGVLICMPFAAIMAGVGFMTGNGWLSVTIVVAVAVVAGILSAGIYLVTRD